jgi:hypothetical protein
MSYDPTQQPQSWFERKMIEMHLWPSWQQIWRLTELPPMKRAIMAARDDILAAVEPGELRLDVLPIISARTEADWKKQGLRLILLQTRGVAQPTSGMSLRAISHQIEITAPPRCQFIDAKPDSEMEVIGEREISTTERGKLAYSDSEEGKLGASLTGVSATLEASLGHKQESSLEAEATAGENRH